MILAIDGGTANCGWAVIEPLSAFVVELGVIHQEPDAALAKSTDRSARAHVQAVQWRALVMRHGVRSVVAEAASFSPRRFTMAVGLCMSIGALTGVAAALELELYEVAPKAWQHAVLGRARGDRAKVEYADVERATVAHINRCPAAAAMLRAIKPALRNHPVDAVGIGAMQALRPGEATRIGARVTAQAERVTMAGTR